MDTNTKALAKLTFNARVGLYTLLVAFTTNNKFTQRQADFVSGHITKDELAAQLNKASAALRTNNIVMVQ